MTSLMLLSKPTRPASQRHITYPMFPTGVLGSLSSLLRRSLQQLVCTLCISFVTARRHASAVYAVVVCLSVCPSQVGVLLKRLKRRIMQVTSNDSPGTLVFCCRKYRQNSNGVTPNGGAKCRLDWQLSKITRYNSKTSTVASVVSSIASLSSSASTHVCNTFAVMQRVALVHHRQPILVLLRSLKFAHRT